MPKGQGQVRIYQAKYEYLCVKTNTIARFVQTSRSEASAFTVIVCMYASMYVLPTKVRYVYFKYIDI